MSAALNRVAAPSKVFIKQGICAQPSCMHHTECTTQDALCGMHHAGYTTWEAPCGMHHVGYTTQDVPFVMHYVGCTTWDALQGKHDVSMCNA